MAKKETDKQRKKRLEAQRQTVKKAKKPSTKKAQEASAAEIGSLRSTGDTNINKMVELGLPIPPAGEAATPAAPKKKASKPRPPGSVKAVGDVAPKTGQTWRSLGNEAPNTEYIEEQRNRDLNEIGERSAKYTGQIEEIPATEVPKNVVNPEEDPLRPKIHPNEDLFTPAGEAKREERLPAGTQGAKPYTFGATVKSPKAEQNVGELTWRRERKNLEGLPGDENGVNALALGLAKRDHALAKESGKTVNEMDPSDPEPSDISHIYYGHHRRLAKVMLAGDLSEDHIAKSAQGTGATFVGKVKYLHKIATDYAAAKHKFGVDIDSERVTHWVHPTTGVAHAISENHPDMPKTVNPHGGVSHAFWRSGGVEDRVRKDSNTGSWVMDKKTGNADIDSSLGWDTDKPQGWNVINLRGGVRALKLNQAPSGSKSLWEHEVNNMKSEFPLSVSEDSRLTHKAHANRIADALASSAGVDAPTRSDKLRRATRGPKRGNISGPVVSRGRTRSRGFTVTESGEAAPTVATETTRARVLRPEMIAPSKQFGDSGYQEGGSVLETQTGDVQENVRVPSLLPKKVTRKKSAIKPSGEVVNVPPQRGALVQKRAVATIPQTPKIQGQQWAPQPRWAEPNVLPTTEEWNAQGGSDAKPITRDNARAIVTKRVIPDPKAAKKNPKTKKVKTVYDVQKPMVDQKIPGFENFGEVVKEHKETAPTRQLQILEGPITAAQDYAETIAPYKSSSGSTRATTGRVTSVVDSEETPIAPVRPTVSSQLAKIPGNSPVDLPTTPVSKGKPKGKKVLSYRENKVEVVPPAAKPKKVKEAPEQLAFPGMESTSTTHAEGQQWATAKQLGEKTLGLQAKSQTAGVPGGSNPIEVKRGTEAKKPTGSFKKR